MEIYIFIFCAKIESYLFIIKLTFDLQTNHKTMGYDKTIESIFIGFVVFCLFCFNFTIIGLSSYGIYVSNNMPDVKQNLCKDYNCTVNVIGKHCRARFTEVQNDVPINVKCDKSRNGFYEVILPCDADSGGNPVINCDIKNVDKFDILGSSILGITFSIFLACVYMIVICIYLVNGEPNAAHKAKKATCIAGGQTGNFPVTLQSETAYHELDDTDCKIHDDCCHQSNSHNNDSSHVDTGFNA